MLSKGWVLFDTPRNKGEKDNRISVKRMFMALSIYNIIIQGKYILVHVLLKQCNKYIMDMV